MTRRAIVCGLVLLANIGLAAQQDTAFSGVWKQTNPPGRLVWHIEQSARGVTLRVMVDDREVSTSTWTFGGPPTIRSSGLGNAPAETTAVLLKDNLIFRGTTTTAQGETVPFEETWRLDPDDNMTVRRQITAPTASFHNEQTFARTK